MCETPKAAVERERAGGMAIPIRINNYSDPRQCDFYMPECCNNFFSTRKYKLCIDLSY